LVGHCFDHVCEYVGDVGLEEAGAGWAVFWLHVGVVVLQFVEAFLESVFVLYLVKKRELQVLDERCLLFVYYNRRLIILVLLLVHFK
jgi:hypothetical protein